MSTLPKGPEGSHCKPDSTHPSALEVKDWIDEITVTNRVYLQQKTIDFLLKAYGGLLISTVVIFFLQGFKIRGFNLDPALLKWLGAATISEIVGLLTLTLGAVFRGSKGL